MTHTPTSMLGESFSPGQTCWCYNPGNPNTEREFITATPDLPPTASQGHSARGCLCPCSISLFLSAGHARAALLPPSFSPSVFPFCRLLPVSQRLLLSPSPSEEAGHRSAEWEEGSVINRILCCLHKHSEYTDS